MFTSFKVDIIKINIPAWGYFGRTKIYIYVISTAVSRDIPNEDKTFSLFKNLRLEIFASLCVIPKVVSRDIPNEDKRTGLFKNFRLEILQVHVLNHRVPQRYPQ